MDASQVEKLEEQTLRSLKESPGPADECLCSILAPPVSKQKSIKGSIKKAFSSLMGKNRAGARGGGVTLPGAGRSVVIPLTFTKGGKGIFTSKEEVKRSTPCGKCGCDKEKVVLRHMQANIRISAPDVSSLCPCSTECIPGKDKFNNNIQVTLE